MIFAYYYIPVSADALAIDSRCYSQSVPILHYTYRYRYYVKNASADAGFAGLCFFLRIQGVFKRRTDKAIEPYSIEE